MVRHAGRACHLPGARRLRLGLLAVALCALPAAARALDAQVTLTRGACERRCPVYDVTVGGDGSVVFAGRHFVRRAGRATRRIPAAEAAALLRRFAGEDFAAAPERVAPGGAECGQTRTDGQLVTLTFRGGASERRVTLDTRCLSPAADRLRDLADAVDATARSRAFLR